MGVLAIVLPWKNELDDSQKLAVTITGGSLFGIGLASKAVYELACYILKTINLLLLNFN